MIHNLEICMGDRESLIRAVTDAVGTEYTRNTAPRFGTVGAFMASIGMDEVLPTMTIDEGRRIVLGALIRANEAVTNCPFDTENPSDMEWFINKAKELLGLKGELAVSQLVLEDGRTVLGVSYAEAE